MSKIDTANYYYKICPSCNSKKLQRIGVTDMSDGVWNKETVVTVTGHLCGNCKRVVPHGEEKYIYDCAEIRRDITKLQKLLEETKKRK